MRKWQWFLVVVLYYMDYEITDFAIKSDLKTNVFIRQVDINHFIILSWGFWTLLKINSAEGLEKLHRAVLIQLVLIVFHQDTAMKGIMTVDHTIASNHWLENCHTLDWLLWSSATLKRASDLKTKKELFRWKWQITNDLSQPGLQNC